MHKYSLTIFLYSWIPHGFDSSSSACNYVCVFVFEEEEEKTSNNRKQLQQQQQQQQKQE